MLETRLPDGRGALPGDESRLCRRAGHRSNLRRAARRVAGVTSTRAWCTLEVDGQRSDLRDIGIYFWRRQALDVLENAIRGAGVGRRRGRADPRHRRSGSTRRICGASSGPASSADGKRCHTNKVPCHTDLEKRSPTSSTARRTSSATSRTSASASRSPTTRATALGSTIPDFIIVAREADGREVMWLAETKGEIRSKHGAQERGGTALVREDEPDRLRPMAVSLRATAEV